MDHTLPGAQLLVLVVDDAPGDRGLIEAILEEEPGWAITCAGDGVEALQVLGREPVRVVLTDLLMPRMNGMELTEAVRRQYPLVPVVLMTAYGNEDVAIEALRKGAASYVPKRALQRELAQTLEQVLTAAQVERRQQQLLERLQSTESYFVLENDRAVVPALVAHVQEYLVRLALCDHNQKIRVCVALEEALVNAIYHGNLEVSSAVHAEGPAAFYQLGETRRQQAPYRDRRVHVSLRLSRDEAVFVVRDEGPGFDPATLPDPRDLPNLDKTSGRGMLLIRTFMDEVAFNDKGNQITLVKRRDVGLAPHA